MDNMTPQAAFEELDILLDQERTALLSGDLQQISELLEQKEQLIDLINDMQDAEEQSLAGLIGKVNRNQVLLDGALRGIRNVAARMSELRQVRRSMDTYDETGRKTTIQGSVVSKVERHA